MPGDSAKKHVNQTHSKSKSKQSKSPITPAKSASGSGGSKLKRLRDKNAPKIPMNAYHRFVAHRQKESTAHGHGGGGHSRETAVKFGAEWAVLSEQEKKPFYDEYARAREDYYRQMEEYKKTEQYSEFQKKKSAKRRSKGVWDEDHQGPSSSGRGAGPAFLPPNLKQIFSKEFLDYNKNQEKRLREVRGQINELEEKIHLLDTHCASLDEQARAEQAATRAAQEDIARWRAKMERWRHIVHGAIGADHPEESMEALIERLERMADGRGGKNSGAQLAAIREAFRKAEAATTTPAAGTKRKK